MTTSKEALNIEISKKRGELDTILDAALDDLADESDDDDEEEDDDDNSGNGNGNGNGNGEETYKSLEDTSNLHKTTRKDNVYKNHNDNEKEKENSDKKWNDVTNLERELETMMKELLLGDSIGETNDSSTSKSASASAAVAAVSNIMNELNAMNDTTNSVNGINGVNDVNGESFMEKELMNLFHQMENENIHKHNEGTIKTTKTTTATTTTDPNMQKDKNQMMNQKKYDNAKDVSKSSSMKQKTMKKEYPNLEPKNNIDRGVAKVLQEMAKGVGAHESTPTSTSTSTSTSEMPPNLDAAQMEQMGEELMESMLEEFEKIGQKSDAGDLVNDMMKQLLSKEIMYEPMKKVTDLFPAWLATNKSSISEKEYNR